MMMKIFGAVLIISGGYLLGKIRSVQQRKRIIALQKIQAILGGFEGALSEYRCSIDEYLKNQGFSEGEIKIDGLIFEDHQKLLDLTAFMKNAGYREALDKIRFFLKEQKVLLNTLGEEAKTTGKALPLVTATIGFLVAVFLL